MFDFRINSTKLNNYYCIFIVSDSSMFAFRIPDQIMRSVQKVWAESPYLKRSHSKGILVSIQCSLQMEVGHYHRFCLPHHKTLPVSADWSSQWVTSNMKHWAIIPYRNIPNYKPHFASSVFETVLFFIQLKLC